MAVTVVLAYRELGCEHRRKSFEYVHGWYTRHGFDVVVESGDDTFTRASGINAGIRKASGDIIIQSDPDSLVPIDQLRAAIDLATEDGVVAPFCRYLYLTPEATLEALAGRTDFEPTDSESHGHGGVGNIIVFSRRTWELCDGFDERFGLWGGDDAAFVYAAGAFTQPLRRIDGDVLHLWHPRHPDSYPETRAYVDQFVLVAEYRDAADAGPDAVREYVRNR